MAKIVLTETEVVTLKKLHKQEKKRSYADRIKMVLLRHDGYSQRAIASILLVDEDTLTLWLARFLDREDLTSWYQDNYVGAHIGKMTFKQQSIVLRHISTFLVRKIQDIGAFITAQFDIKYSQVGLYYWLKRTKQSYKQLVRLPGKINHEAQSKFVVKYEHIVSQLTDKQTVMFIDAVHPQHNSTTTRVWTPTGLARYIPSNTGRDHLNINGAYNPFTQDIIAREDKTINAQSTIALLEQISNEGQEYDTIFVFSDNARANKCKAITEWLCQQTKIQMRYLPPYSPNLNLIERLWKVMRSQTIHAHFYATFNEFKIAIRSFFTDAHTQTDVFAKAIGTKLQLFDLT